VEQLGARSGTEGVKTLLQPALDVLEVHGGER
jgi:hypothetical protein